MGKAAQLKSCIRSEQELEVKRLGPDRFRVGYCCQCGACCKTINMDTKGSKTAAEWLELHNVKVTKIGDIKRDPREEAVEFTMAISFPCPCRELSVDATGAVHTCNIYETRPSICAMYPKHQSGYKTCTYIFINTEEFQIFSQEYTTYWREQHGQEKTLRIA